MRTVDLIQKKRDGGRLSGQEIRALVGGYVAGDIPDYQMSALLMAIYFRGLDPEETSELTLAMADSGDRIDLSAIPGIKVDKHSTGGVGDKTTLIVAPIVASLGVPVAKMSGRGLGHTGGTIDKLEAIPGFRTALPTERFLAQVQEIGIAIAAQTGDLAPADKLLYALRDVTATVDQASLIAASVMSKKIASGADAIVLDVKTGSGAFMKTTEEALALARTMIAIASAAGRRAVALITDMDRPLGAAVGNSLEVLEALDVLAGQGPADLAEVSFALATEMLLLAGYGEAADCRQAVQKTLQSGQAEKCFYDLVAAQGGETEGLRRRDLGRAAALLDVRVQESGYLGPVNTEAIGLVAVGLGAGRATKDEAIDPLAGLLLHKKTGGRVRAGETLATLYTSDPKRLTAAAADLLAACPVVAVSPASRPPILARVAEDGVSLFEEQKT